MQLVPVVLALLASLAHAQADFIPGDRVRRSSDTMRGPLQVLSTFTVAGSAGAILSSGAVQNWFSVGASTLIVTNRSVGIGAVPGTQIALDIAKSSEASSNSDPKALNIRSWNYTYNGAAGILAGGISSNRIGRATFTRSGPGSYSATDASTLKIDGPPIPAGGVSFTSHTIGFAHGVNHSIAVENAPLTGGEGSNLTIRGSSGYGIEGGDAGGGHVAIQAGNGDGAGTGGSIKLTPGTSVSGAAGSIQAIGSLLVSRGVSIRGNNTEDFDVGGIEAALFIRPDLDAASNDFPILSIGNDASLSGSGYPVAMSWDGTNRKITVDNNGGYSVGFDVSGDLEAGSFTANNGIVIGQVFVAGRHEIEIAGSTFTVRGGEVAIGTSAASANAGDSRLYVYGLVTSSTPIPSITCTAGTGVLAATSNTQSGKFTAGAGAGSCTITWSTLEKRWPKEPTCVCVNETSNDGTRPVATTTNLQCISWDGNFGGETIKYSCWGAP
jgi:hypothetical protein